MTSKAYFAFTVLLIALFSVFLLGCGSKKNPEDLKPIPPEFYGEWQGQDGSRLQIFANGKGNFKTGGKSVEGGTVEYTPTTNSFEISLFGIGETFRIDRAPTASSNEMVLNGMIFRRVGGFAPESQSPSSPFSSEPSSSFSSGTPSVPFEDELKRLTYKSLRNFGDAVMSGDFTLFHLLCAPEFQNQFSPAQLRKTFAEFVEKKVDVALLVQDSPITFSAPPRIDENGVLRTQGIVTSKAAPVNVRFNLDYLLRNGEWQLINIGVYTEPQTP